ncbi:MAG TPA: hypothetical protein VJ183_07865 [Chloroflexia bacterium]|nr:hypothetical protein [Chloroflexia bacterium]
MARAQQRLAWGLTASLGALYIGGFFLGWASAYASWHLLLVIVAILFLYSVLSQRGA